MREHRTQARHSWVADLHNGLRRHRRRDRLAHRTGNRGLACMFTMMNSARLSVGLQGVARSEGATQHALAYARDRKQGRAPNTSAPAGAMDTIIHHPDVARTLMTMRAYTDATRAICYVTAGALDRAHRLT